MRGRATVRLVLVGIASLVAVLAGCAPGAPPPPDSPLAGTKMKGSPATEFNLVNEHGEKVSLAALRGKVITVSFQYVNCPDSLPVIMEKFLLVHSRLGESAKDVVFLFISVDPERDSVERVRQYLEEQDAVGRVSFLTGERAELEPLWKAYYLSVVRFPVKPGSEEARRYGGYAIGHTEVIYLIDKAGRLRCLLRPDMDPDDLYGNLQTLLREP